MNKTYQKYIYQHAVLYLKLHKISKVKNVQKCDTKRLSKKIYVHVRRVIFEAQKDKKE